MVCNSINSYTTGNSEDFEKVPQCLRHPNKHIYTESATPPQVCISLEKCGGK
jgi:hypothetical protein